ncbi:MAG: hypothetical protein U5N86_12540 [Planctomycetota bacterium]|nr:hypothetical protein [Planctomycetota bacterium]
MRNALLTFAVFVFVLMSFCSTSHAEDYLKGYKAFDSMTYPSSVGTWHEIADPSNLGPSGLGDTSASLQADDGYYRVNLPFGVRIGYETYYNVYIHTNGAVTFAPKVGDDVYFGMNFPAMELPYAVAPFWTDLAPADGQSGNGEIRYQTVGTMPNRKFVVEWYQVAHKNSPTDRYTFQLQIVEHEGDLGQFVFIYKDMQGTYADGSNSIIGMNIFPDFGSVTYAAYAPDSIPTGTELYHTVHLQKLDHWRRFPSMSTPEISTNAPYPGDNGANITRTRDGVFFAGTLADNSVFYIRAVSRDSTEMLPNPFSLIGTGYDSQQYNLSALDFDLVNIGQGRVALIARVRVMDMNMYKKDGISQSNYATLFAAMWNGTNWVEIGTNSLSTGIPGMSGLDVYEFEAAYNSFTGWPSIAFIAWDYMQMGYMPNVYYTYFAGMNWTGTEGSMGTGGLSEFSDPYQYKAAKTDGALTGDPGYASKISHCVVNGDPYIAFLIEPYMEGMTQICVVTSASGSWDYASYSDGGDFRTDASYSSSPSIRSYGLAGAVIAWHDTNNTNPLRLLYTPNAGSTNFIDASPAAGTLPEPDDTTEYLGANVQVMMDFKNRPILVYQVMDELNASLSLMAYRRELDDSTWRPLFTSQKFNGLYRERMPGAKYEIAPDEAGNPSIIFSASIANFFKADNAQFNGGENNAMILHYVIDVDIKFEDNRGDYCSIPHSWFDDYSQISPEFFFDDAYANENLNVTITSTGSLVTPAVANGTTNSFMDLDVDSTGQSAGIYDFTSTVDIQGVYDSPRVFYVRLAKAGLFPDISFPTDYNDLQTALNALQPGQKLSLEDGDYDFSGLTLPPVLILMGESIDGTRIYNLDLSNTVAMQLLNLTFVGDTTKATTGLIAGDYPIFADFADVLFDFMGTAAHFDGVNAMFYSCTLVSEPFRMAVEFDIGSPRRLIFSSEPAYFADCIVDMPEIISIPGETYLYNCYRDDAYAGFVASYMDVVAAFVGYVDPANRDFHLQSTEGHWDPDTVNFVADNVDSPLLDTAQYHTFRGNETMPHNYIDNLGAYGGTQWASLSPMTQVSWTMTATGGTTRSAYRMRAVPLLPINSEIDMLNPVMQYFGGFDDKLFQLFAYHSGNESYISPRIVNTPIEWTPGRGFWFISANNCSITFTGARPKNGVGVMPLKQGWNMVGNCNDEPLYLADCFVIDDEGIGVPFANQTGGQVLTKLDRGMMSLYPYIPVFHRIYGGAV